MLVDRLDARAVAWPRFVKSDDEQDRPEDPEEVEAFDEAIDECEVR